MTIALYIIHPSTEKETADSAGVSFPGIQKEIERARAENAIIHIIPSFRQNVIDATLFEQRGPINWVRPTDLRNISTVRLVGGKLNHCLSGCYNQLLNTLHEYKQFPTVELPLHAIYTKRSKEYGTTAEQDFSLAAQIFGLEAAVLTLFVGQRFEDGPCSSRQEYSTSIYVNGQKITSIGCKRNEHNQVNMNILYTPQHMEHPQLEQELQNRYIQVRSVVKLR